VWELFFYQYQRNDYFFYLQLPQPPLLTRRQRCVRVFSIHHRHIKPHENRQKKRETITFVTYYCLNRHCWRDGSGVCECSRFITDTSKYTQKDKQKTTNDYFCYLPLRQSPQLAQRQRCVCVISLRHRRNKHTQTNTQNTKKQTKKTKNGYFLTRHCLY
jgi:hypothetical protein